MKNPSKSESLNRKLVSTARSIVTKQVELPQGAMRLLNNLYWLGLINERPLAKESEGILNAYYSQIREYPIGAEQAYWNPDALLEQQQKLQRVTDLYKARLLAICGNILKLSEKST